MAGYIGNIPVPQGTQTRQNFTATASQTSFPTIGYTAGFIDVYLNGVKLISGTDFTASNGSDVVLTSAASASDVLDVVIFDTFNTSSGTFSDTTLKNNVTLKNDTHEDSDGGRASKIIYQGEQSGGEISTLAEIQASHDGTADDQKSDLIFRTNDGNDGASPTEAMRIDSSGNVGIGTSSPNAPTAIVANTTTYEGLELVTPTGDGSGEFHIGVHDNGGTGGRNIVFKRGGSDGMDTESMRIDSAGNVGIGTNNPDSTLTMSDTVPIIKLIDSDDNTFSRVYHSAGKLLFDADKGDTGSGSTIQFGVDDTERMRIASDGALLVGTTSNPSGGKLAIDYARGSSAGMRIKDTVGSGGTGVIADFYNSSNNSMGAITHDSSNITYGGTSDYRLKENINYTWDGITKVKELKPARFTWIDNPDVGIIDGFLAHEVSSVVPKAVVGQKDASETYTDEDGNEQTKIIPQQLDQSKLVPLLTKALQEAIAKIETLETKVAALEAE